MKWGVVLTQDEMQRQMRREEDTLKDDVYNYFDVRLRERKQRQ